LYYAMCHNLKPSKIDDKDSLSIFKTKFPELFSFATCHYVSCWFLWQYIGGIQ
jgi:hypothetical protein